MNSSKFAVKKVDPNEVMIANALTAYDAGQLEEASQWVQKGLKTCQVYVLYLLHGILNNSEDDIKKGLFYFTCVEYSSKKLPLSVISFAHRKFFPLDDKASEEKPFVELDACVKAKDVTVLPFLNRAIKKSPFDAKLYTLHAELNEENVELSTISYALACWCAPENIKFRLNLIGMHLRGERLKVAEQCFMDGLSNILENSPMMASCVKMYSLLLSQMGAEFYGEGKNDFAEKYLDRSLELRLDDKASVYYLRGLVREAKNNIGGAKADFERARSLDNKREDIKQKYVEYFPPADDKSKNKNKSGIKKPPAPKKAKPKASTTPGQGLAAIRAALARDNQVPAATFSTQIAAAGSGLDKEKLPAAAEVAVPPAPAAVVPPLTVADVEAEKISGSLTVSPAIAVDEKIVINASTASQGTSFIATTLKKESRLSANAATFEMKSRTVQAPVAPELSRAIVPSRNNTALSSIPRQTQAVQSNTVWACNSFRHFSVPVVLHPTIPTRFTFINGWTATFYPLPLRVVPESFGNRVEFIPEYMVQRRQLR